MEVLVADETYRTIIKRIAHTKSSSLTVFADFCRIAACCLAAGAREDEYFEAIKPYSKEELNDLSKALALLINEMESKPFTDVLGTFYLDVASHSSKQARGEFYTPQEISRLMAKISCNAQEVIAKGKPITVNDPACGASGMILAIAEEFAPNHVDLLRITVQDISPVATDMSYVNLTLWGIPAHVICGDTLRMTVNNQWKNIHWHRVGEDQRLAAEQMLEIIKSPMPTTEENKADITLPPVESRLGKNGQFEFDMGL